MKNPWRAVSEIAGWTGVVVLALIFLGAVAVAIAVVIIETGWWAFLWIPLGLIAIPIFSILLSLLEEGAQRLARWWRRRQIEWDEKHSEVSS